MATTELDSRFCYEPIMAPHPITTDWPVEFLGKTLKAPIWVSSMTGGTQRARHINENLAKACQEFGMGMGLGSCRSMLTDPSAIADFDVRKIIGDGLPLYGNLGIAQVEQLLEAGQWHLADVLVQRLSLDGLIVHINPLQEWFQPEGDRIRQRPIDTIRRLLDCCKFPIIVKEVGQGMGPESLRALLSLPLAAVDFAASGGTNFSLLELERQTSREMESQTPLAYVGHSAEQMLQWVNQYVEEVGSGMACRQLIISGGIGTFLDGYHLVSRSLLPAVYGQASAFLRWAMHDYELLQQYVRQEIDGLACAKAYLRINEQYERPNL